MSEGVPPDDGLVVLHREGRDRRHEFRRPGQQLGVYAGMEGQNIGARPHRHDDFLQRGVAGALADAVDRAFDLPRAAAHAGERIGDGQPQIVVTMHREDGLVGIGHALPHAAEQRLIFRRSRVADGVRDVDRGRAGVDRDFDRAAQKIELRAGAVLGRPFDIGDMIARPRHRGGDQLQHARRLQLELVFHVQRRGGDEGVDARATRLAQGLGAAVDVFFRGAREAGDGAVFHAPRDLKDAFEIARAGDRKARLDDVDAQRVEQIGDLQFFLQRHGGAGRLLAVAQRGVENNDAVGVMVLRVRGRAWVWNVISHWSVPAVALPAARASYCLSRA